MGLFYAGSKQKASELKLKGVEKIKNPLDANNDYVRDIEIYEVQGEKGVVELGIEQSGEEYYLWLIEPKTGLSVRA